MTISAGRRAGAGASRAFLATLFITLAAASPAWAHAILVESQPASGGSVPAGQIALHLRFNSRVDQERSRLTLNRPDHTQTVLPIAADSAKDVLASHADLPPGAYSVRWQVLATDGHITRGDLPFTVSKTAP